MRKNFFKIPLLLSLIFFSCSALFFFFFYKYINEKDYESQLKEMTWQAEAQRREEVRSLERSIKGLEGERAEFDTHFAQSSDIVPFLDTIEGLAPKVGVKAEMTSVDIAENGAGLLVGMKASGSFGGLYKFLRLIENSPYELEFLTFKIEKESGAAGGKSDASKWNAAFKIKLLSFVNKK